MVRFCSETWHVAGPWVPAALVSRPGSPPSARPGPAHTLAASQGRARGAGLSAHVADGQGGLFSRTKGSSNNGDVTANKCWRVCLRKQNRLIRLKKFHAFQIIVHHQHASKLHFYNKCVTLGRNVSVSN